LLHVDVDIYGVNALIRWSQVGELFKAAGQAFSQLGDQALQVHSLSEGQHSSV